MFLSKPNLSLPNLSKSFAITTNTSLINRLADHLPDDPVDIPVDIYSTYSASSSPLNVEEAEYLTFSLRTTQTISRGRGYK